MFATQPEYDVFACWWMALCCRSKISLHVDGVNPALCPPLPSVLLNSFLPCYPPPSAASYLPVMDRVKLAVLRRLPGPAAALVASDLAARLIIKQMTPVMQVT